MTPHRYRLSVAAAVLACAGLGGCVAAPALTPSNDVLAQARGPAENRRLHTDLISKMIAEDRLYAALAHLEAQEQEFGVTPPLMLLRAEILRKLGRAVEAEALYRKLLAAGDYRGQAHHGLGLVYAPQNLALGMGHLQTAATLRPTDAQVRNDLGYALLQQGHLVKARLELATAYQLQPDFELARNNYIVVLLATGGKAEAARIASEAGLDANTIKRLRSQALNLQARLAEARSDAATAPVQQTAAAAAPPPNNPPQPQTTAEAGDVVIGGGGG